MQSELRENWRSQLSLHGQLLYITLSTTTLFSVACDPNLTLTPSPGGNAVLHTTSEPFHTILRLTKDGPVQCSSGFLSSFVLN